MWQKLSGVVGLVLISLGASLLLFWWLPLLLINKVLKLKQANKTTRRIVRMADSRLEDSLFNWGWGLMALGFILMSLAGLL